MVAELPSVAFAELSSCFLAVPPSCDVMSLRECLLVNVFLYFAALIILVSCCLPTHTEKLMQINSISRVF